MKIRLTVILTVAVILAAFLLIEKARINEIDDHCRKGINFLQEGRYMEAMGSLEKALRIDPDSKEANAFLGLCYEKLGQNEKALY